MLTLCLTPPFYVLKMVTYIKINDLLYLNIFIGWVVLVQIQVVDDAGAFGSQRYNIKNYGNNKSYFEMFIMHHKNTYAVRNLLKKRKQKTLEEKFPIRDNINLKKVNDKTLDLINEECQLQITRQHNSITSIQNRSGILIGFLGVMLATIVSSSSNIVHMEIVFYLGMGSLILSLLFAIIAWAPVEYMSISPYHLYNKCIYDNEKKTKDFVADLDGSNYEINRDIIKGKNNVLSISVIFLFLTILFFICNFVIGIVDP